MCAYLIFLCAGLQDRCGAVFAQLANASCVSELEDMKRERQLQQQQPDKKSGPLALAAATVGKPKLARLHAAHALSMDVVLGIGMEMGSHSADCWLHVFRWVTHYGMWPLLATLVFSFLTDPGKYFIFAYSLKKTTESVSCRSLHTLVATMCKQCVCDDRCCAHISELEHVYFSLGKNQSALPKVQRDTQQVDGPATDDLDLGFVPICTLTERSKLITELSTRVEWKMARKFIINPEGMEIDQSHLVVSLHIKMSQN